MVLKDGRDVEEEIHFEDILRGEVGNAGLPVVFEKRLP